MNIRLVQICGFLMTVLGWIFMACTMAMEGWKITSVGGMGGSSIVKISWFWSSLWRSCFTDSTAVTNCYDFPVLWSVDGNIQIVRALLMAALAVGMLGFILSLMGMECTFIGGTEKSKQRMIFSGGLCHIISGTLAASGYAVYAVYVSAEYFNPFFVGLKFDLGTPLFLGWVGSAFHMTGGGFFLISVCKPYCQDKRKTMVTPAHSYVEPHLANSSTSLSSVPSSTSKVRVSPAAKIDSRSPRTGESNRKTKSRRSSGFDNTGRSSRSDGKSSRSGRSSRSRSRGSVQSDRSSSVSRTVSSLSNEREEFIKSTYI
ncbi:hypothetical protein UPYG_G00020210 [Umbra pygmaea]|uniref:Claudin n=1 Tax=Umbra pygmaea TaxID=75934 RepID=A0ABD0XKI5_UMBPY